MGGEQMEGLPPGSLCSPGLSQGRGPETRDVGLSGVAGRTEPTSESWSAPGQLFAWAGTLEALGSTAPLQLQRQRSCEAMKDTGLESGVPSFHVVISLLWPVLADSFDFYWKISPAFFV